MEKKSLFHTLILFFLLLAVVSFPIDLFVKDMTIQYSVRVGLNVFYLIFSLLYIRFSKFIPSYTGRTRIANLLILLPLFFIAFTNPFYVVIIRQTASFNTIFNSIYKAFSTNPTFEILTLVNLILLAINEEIFFRFVFQRVLLIAHKMLRIFASAGMFSLCHLLQYLFNFSALIDNIPNALVQLVYTFFIGVVIGVLYEYTNNISFATLFHILFNLSNDYLYNSLDSGTISLPYYINALCFGIFGIAYICIFYFLILKRDKR